jgi:hypothetical protein
VIEGQSSAGRVANVSTFEDPALMTVVGEEFHVTKGAERYWSGGLLRVTGGTGLGRGRGTVRFVFAGEAGDEGQAASYEVRGDALTIEWSGVKQSGRGFGSVVERYRRVAKEPPPELLALIGASAERG